MSESAAAGPCRRCLQRLAKYGMPHRSAYSILASGAVVTRSRRYDIGIDTLRKATDVGAQIGITIYAWDPADDDQ
jgi:hypothetical protein